jgi:hypothetical protein
MTAHAEWTMLTEKENNSTYIDYSTIKLQDKFRTVETLDSYTNPQKLPDRRVYKSITALLIFDCVEKKFDILNLNYRSDSEGQGNIFLTLSSENEPREFMSPQSNSYIEIAQHKVCSFNIK